MRHNYIPQYKDKCSLLTIHRQLAPLVHIVPLFSKVILDQKTDNGVSRLNTGMWGTHIKAYFHWTRESCLSKKGTWWANQYSSYGSNSQRNWSGCYVGKKCGIEGWGVWWSVLSTSPDDYAHLHSIRTCDTHISLSMIDSLVPLLQPNDSLLLQ